MKKIATVPMQSSKKVISNGEFGVSVEIGSSRFGRDENRLAFLKITDLGAGFRGKILRDDRGNLDSIELSAHGEDGIIMLMDAMDFATEALLQYIVEEV